MSRRIFSMLGCALVSGILLDAGQQQTTNPNPEHSQGVFLDNHPKSKKDKNPTSRIVSGQVTDDTGQPLEGALVTLTDTKTNERRTFFTKKDGRYSFDDLSFTVDYQLQARWKNFNSDQRKLSQYDHTARVVRLLQVTTPEGYAAAPPAEAKKDDPKPKQ